MAGLSQNKGIYTVILSKNEHKGRPRISIGKVTRRQASEFKLMLGRYIEAKAINAAIPSDIAEWLSGLSGGIKERLVKIGLLEPRPDDISFLDFAMKFIEAKRKDPYTKQRTVDRYLLSYKKLEVFFRGESLSSVTPAMARNWRAYLKVDMGLQENTIAKHIRHAKTIFLEAVKQGIIAKSPFEGEKTAMTIDPDRAFFVDAELTRAVMDAMPTTEWKLLFALSRIGGLRVPSDVSTLKWNDIDFDKKTITVRSPKTAHHSDRGIRTLPMFIEIEPLLVRQYNDAAAGEVYVLPRLRTENPRTMFTKYLNKAGIEPWPKLFHNCRASRETELIKQVGIEAACAWIGNSPEVALKHYSMVSAAERQKAAAVKVMSEGLKAVSFEPENTPKKSALKSAPNYQETFGSVLQVVSGESDVNPLSFKTLQEKSPLPQIIANKGLIPPRGVEPLSDDVNISDYNKDTYVKKLEHFKNQSAPESAPNFDKFKKLELIRDSLDKLSADQIQRIIDIIFEVR
jgi:integrase